MQAIPEYLALYKDNAIVDGNKLSWNVQQSYYTNSRGPICYVSLVSCAMDTNDTDQIIVKYHGSQNQNTTDRQPSVIGMMDKKNFSSLQSAEPIKLLISSRPQNITIQTNLVDNTAHVPTDAVFVLKFEYLDAKEQTNNLINQEYSKL
tara:strand:+ start:1211 stop:1654 length:444 start_codon:yes stop_codon:yes gene_type:complete